tara:strand:- start:908 stop:1351 length:444 start_codon:yes stop_codon:yes gene_type:complete
MPRILNTDLFKNNLLALCEEPMLIPDLAEKVGCGYSTIYRHLNTLNKDGLIIRTWTVIDGVRRAYYQAAEDSNAELVDNQVYKTLEQPLKGDGIKKTKASIHDDGVVTVIGNRTIVKGLKGYHPERSKDEFKKSPRRWVSGSTLEGF